MKKILVGLAQVVVIFLLLVLAFVFSRAPNLQEIQSDSAVVASNTESVLSVAVVKPQAITSQLFIDSTGTAKTSSIVPMATQVSGQVVWISDSLRTGGSFAKDEELLRIDATDFELALDQAEANLQTAKANLELREAERLAGEENWQIMNPGKEVPTLVARVPQINQSRASIAAADASLAIAKLRLSRTSYSLPFDGKVLATDVGVGQLLTQGQSFGSAYDTASLEVEVNVAESEMRLLEPVVGRAARISRSRDSFDAVVDRISASIDIRTRTTTLYISVDSNSPLLPGHFVDVRIFGRLDDDTFRLPESVEQSRSTFWIVKEGKLESVEVRIIAREGNELVVPAFDYGEGIVVGSPRNAYSGMPVTVSANRS